MERWKDGKMESKLNRIKGDLVRKNFSPIDLVTHLEKNEFTILRESFNKLQTYLRYCSRLRVFRG